MIITTTAVVLSLLVVDNLIDRLRQLHIALNKPKPAAIEAAKKAAFVPAKRDAAAIVVKESEVKFARRKQ